MCTVYTCLCDSVLQQVVGVHSVLCHVFVTVCCTECCWYTVYMCLCDSLLFSKLSVFTVHTSVFVTVCCSVCCWCTVYMSCDSVIQQVVSVYCIHVVLYSKLLVCTVYMCCVQQQVVCVYCIHVSSSTASC